MWCKISHWKKLVFFYVVTNCCVIKTIWMRCSTVVFPLRDPKLKHDIQFFERFQIKCIQNLWSFPSYNKVSQRSLRNSAYWTCFVWSFSKNQSNIVASCTRLFHEFHIFQWLLKLPRPFFVWLQILPGQYYGIFVSSKFPVIPSQVWTNHFINHFDKIHNQDHPLQGLWGRHGARGNNWFRISRHDPAATESECANPDQDWPGYRSKSEGSCFVWKIIWVIL